MASLAADPRFASFQDEVLKGFFEKSRLAEENRGRLETARRAR